MRSCCCILCDSCCRSSMHSMSSCICFSRKGLVWSSSREKSDAVDGKPTSSWSSRRRADARCELRTLSGSSWKISDPDAAAAAASPANFPSLYSAMNASVSRKARSARPAARARDGS